MIVPTTDYSSVRQAQSQATQARRSQFIAPQIDYNTESLRLQEKGIEKTISHIDFQKNLNTLQFMYETGKTMVEAAFAAAYAKQAAQAQSMGTEMANASKIEEAKLVANGQYYFSTKTDDPTHNTNGVEQDYAHFVGGDKIKAFQDQQIAQIQAQNWFPSIKNQTIQSLQGVYSGSQARMMQDFYANETQARYQLEQQNLLDARNMDIATGTLAAPSYMNTMATIANMRRGPQVSQALAASSIREIDLGVATKEVRQAGISGGELVADNLARQISADRGYNAETEAKLINVGYQAARQEKAKKQNEGMQFMQDFIASGNENYGDAYQQVEQMKADKMPFEQVEAFKEGMEKVQLANTVPIFAELTKDDPANMDKLDLEKKLETIRGYESRFQGCLAAEDLYAKAYSKYSKALSTLNNEEAVADWYNILADPEQVMNIKESDIDKASDLTATQKKTLKKLFKAEQNRIKNEDEKEKAANEKEYKLQEESVLNGLEASVLNKEISVSRAWDIIEDMCSRSTAMAKNGKLSWTTSNNINAMGMKLYDKISDKLKAENKEAFDKLRNKIAKNLKNMEEDKGFWEKTGTNLAGIQEDAEKALLSALVASPDMSKEETSKLLDSISENYTVSMINELNNLREGVFKTKEEEAMEYMQNFQDKENVLTSYDPVTKTFEISKPYNDEYEKAMQTLKNTLKNNYGIDVKENKYTTIRYTDDNGVTSIIPEFEDKEGNRYVFKDQVAYRRYEHSLKEIPIQKPFREEGVSPMQEYLDKNDGTNVGSYYTKNSSWAKSMGYGNAFGGR